MQGVAPERGRRPPRYGPVGGRRVQVGHQPEGPRATVAHADRRWLLGDPGHDVAV